jgi:hypothetical protein
MLGPIAEQDWKIWRKVSVVAYERFCKKVLQSAAAIASSSRDPHNSYEELHAMLQEADKTIASIFRDMRRSTALDQLVYGVSKGIITREELAEFSEHTQRVVRIVLEEE